MYFRYFTIISPWKRTGSFIWINLNPLHPRMLRARFGWNWLSGSREKDCLISSVYFRYFTIISPQKRTSPSFEQTWIPFTQGCFLESLVEIGSVVLEKKIFLNFVSVFSLFRDYLPLVEGWPFIWTNLYPLHPRIFLAKFGWNWLSGSGEVFLISSMYFHYFGIIAPWKRAGPFIWINLNSLLPRMIRVMFGWN